MRLMKKIVDFIYFAFFLPNINEDTQSGLWLLRIVFKEFHSNNMNKFFRRNGKLSQKVKPIIIERASYCMQFEIGTKSIKILRFNKNS